MAWSFSRAGKVLLLIGVLAIVAGLSLQSEPAADEIHRIIAGLLLAAGAICAVVGALVTRTKR
jgi:uncharacterized membrane protein HdeD (DUF308 family)